METPLTSLSKVAMKEFKYRISNSVKKLTGKIKLNSAKNSHVTTASDIDHCGAVTLYSKALSSSGEG